MRLRAATNLAELQSRMPRDLNRRLVGRVLGFAWPRRQVSVPALRACSPAKHERRLRGTRKTRTLAFLREHRLENDVGRSLRSQRKE